MRKLVILCQNAQNARAWEKAIQRGDAIGKPGTPLRMDDEQGSHCALPRRQPELPLREK